MDNKKNKILNKAELNDERIMKKKKKKKIKLFALLIKIEKTKLTII